MIVTWKFESGLRELLEERTGDIDDAFGQAI